MKMINKKVLTTTLAASVVLGGGIAGLLQSKAFADETTPTDTAAPMVQQKGEFKHIKGEFNKMGKAGLNIDDAKLAEAIGITKEDLKAQQKAGKTLLEIGEANGFTQDSLNSAIRQIFTAEIDNAVNSGKITSEQADKQRANLTDLVDKLINGKQGEMGKGMGGKPGQGPGRGFGGGLLGNDDNLATVLGLTKEELKAALKDGKSIAELAQAKGISEDDLISKIKDGLTDTLKKFVENKRQPHEMKQPAATDAPAPTEDAAS